MYIIREECSQTTSYKSNMRNPSKNDRSIIDIHVIATKYNEHYHEGRAQSQNISLYIFAGETEIGSITFSMSVSKHT